MHKRWWTRQASNLRQSGYEPGALPTELRVQQTEYASIPAVWQEKKDVPPGISRTEKLQNTLPRACRAFRLCGLNPSCRNWAGAPLTPKRMFAHGEPHGSALPAPAAAHPLRESLADARCLIGASPRALPAGPQRLQRTGRPALTAPHSISAPAQERLPTSRGSFHAGRFARAPCRIKRTSLYGTREKTIPGSPQSACRSRPPDYFSPALSRPAIDYKKSPLSRRKEGLAPRMAGRDPKIPRPSAEKRRGNSARQETTFLREQPSFRGRRNALLQAIRRKVRMQTRRSSADSFPARAFNAYRAWKYSRGCAQAGQDSGASRPSCT